MTAPPPETFDAVLEAAEPLSPRTKSFRFRFTGTGTMPFRAGQHLRLRAPAAGGFRNIPYSIASPPRDAGRFELCVTAPVGGAGPGYLHGLVPGDTVKASGPYGEFVLPARLERGAVFVATGSGVAPLRSMMLDLLGRGAGRPLTFLFGVRGEEDILYRGQWEDLARTRPEFRAVVTLSAPPAGWRGPRGHVQDVLAEAVTGWGDKEFFLCGWKAMIVAVEAALRAGGVPVERIHYERYG